MAVDQRFQEREGSFRGYVTKAIYLFFFLYIFIYLSTLFISFCDFASFAYFSDAIDSNPAFFHDKYSQESRQGIRD